MGLAPTEIRHIPIPRGLRGYRRGAVEQLLDEIADSYEDVWRDRAELSDRVEFLEEEQTSEGVTLDRLYRLVVGTRRA